MTTKKSLADLSDTELLEALPNPPEQFHLCSDEEVMAWLRKVGEVGGFRGVHLAFSQRHWPGTSEQRARLWSPALRIRDEAGAKEKAQEEERQRKLREKAERAAAKRPKKWYERG